MVVTNLAGLIKLEELGIKLEEVLISLVEAVTELEVLPISLGGAHRMEADRGAVDILILLNQEVALHTTAILEIMAPLVAEKTPGEGDRSISHKLTSNSRTS